MCKNRECVKTTKKKIKSFIERLPHRPSGESTHELKRFLCVFSANILKGTETRLRFYQTG